ncbi:MAG TPA: CehA/McbA family metallohydrolase [Actinomycetota bacterium]|nr:CehA/McbA family metallohydrolase [Actinomycetota bacterium]
MKRCLAALAAGSLLFSMAGQASAQSPTRGPQKKGAWYAGDLHVHTTYSHDSYGGPDDDNTSYDESYTFGWSVGEQGDIARLRGLDYITISDHNDVRSITDPAFGSEGLLWIPAYENSLPGHAQMLGIDRLLDNGQRTLEDVQRLADTLHAEGGAFQINHPSDHGWHDHYGHSFVPDTVEVWNIGAWYHQHPVPAANDNEFSLRFWDEFLDAGHQVGATGGSDNHWRSLTGIAGVGQPTTWVFAKKPTSDSILEAIREGRTTISHQPPAYGGQFAEIEGDRNGDGTFDATLGDTIEPGKPLRVTVDGAVGATLRLVTDGSETLAEVPVTSTPFTYELPAPATSTWLRAEVFTEDAGEVRAELSPVCDAFDGFTGFFDQPQTTYCDNRLLMLALTSPIYIQPDETEAVPSEITP